MRRCNHYEHWILMYCFQFIPAAWGRSTEHYSPYLKHMKKSVRQCRKSQIPDHKQS